MTNISLKNPDESLELFYSILESTSEHALIATDNNNIIILWNEGAKNIYGYTSTEAIGKSVFEYLNSNIESIDLSDSPNIFELKEFKLRIKQKNGNFITVAISITPRLSSNGLELGYLIVSRDITRERIQDRFRDIVLEIASIVNSNDEINVICKNIVTIIKDLLELPVVVLCLFNSLNREFNISAQEGLTNKCKNHSCLYCSNEEKVPKKILGCQYAYSLTKVNSEPLVNHEINKLIKNKKLCKINHTIIHVPLFSENTLLGLLHLVVPNSYNELFREDKILNMISNEITAGIKRKNLILEIKQYADNLEKMVKIRTEQLREKDALLIQSGKLATLGELATGIAHEINQPLSGINLITQGLLLAKSKGKLDDILLSEKLNEIVAQIERISKIISHLRTFARQYDNIKTEVDVRKPLLDVFKLIGQQLINCNIEVKLEITEELPTVLADHNRLEQVFLNLIGNAKDALDEMEQSISSKSLKSNYANWNKSITIKAYAIENELYIEVIDTGIGVPENHINKVFDPFFTTKKVGKGTGLGLSITYGIVNDFNGTIEIQSVEFEGTRFILKFPIYKKVISKTNSQ